MNSPDGITASGSSIWLCAGASTRARLAHSGERVTPPAATVDEVFGWSLDAAAKIETDRILCESITDPAEPRFMAPPLCSNAEILEAAQ